jgi:hypothetical protein
MDISRKDAACLLYPITAHLGCLVVPGVPKDHPERTNKKPFATARSQRP